MKRSLKIRRALLVRIMRFSSLCSASLLASCVMKYGAPEEEPVPVNFNGTVISSATNTEIPGIQVQIMGYHSSIYSETDSAGVFNVSNEIIEVDYAAQLVFTDVDGVANGRFQAKDTIIPLTSSDFQAGVKSNIEIKLDTID